MSLSDVLTCEKYRLAFVPINRTTMVDVHCMNDICWKVSKIHYTAWNCVSMFVFAWNATPYIKIRSRLGSSEILKGWNFRIYCFSAALKNAISIRVHSFLCYVREFYCDTKSNDVENEKNIAWPWKSMKVNDDLCSTKISVFHLFFAASRKFNDEFNLELAISPNRFVSSLILGYN